MENIHSLCFDHLVVEESQTIPAYAAAQLHGSFWTDGIEYGYVNYKIYESDFSEKSFITFRARVYNSILYIWGAAMAHEYQNKHYFMPAVEALRLYLDASAEKVYFVNVINKKIKSGGVFEIIENPWEENEVPGVECSKPEQLVEEQVNLEIYIKVDEQLKGEIAQLTDALKDQFANRYVSIIDIKYNANMFEPFKIDVYGSHLTERREIAKFIRSFIESWIDDLQS